MYSQVTSLTGMNSVVPGLLAFHWLKGRVIGSIIGMGRRPLDSFTVLARNACTIFSRSSGDSNSCIWSGSLSRICTR
ncbi:MAG: hypothetical protein ACE1ZN_05550 [Dehalococcoidia bacterium]